MNKKILKLLYRSFDSQLTKQEQRQLDEALANSQTLREERERILSLRNDISSLAAGSFKPFFAERVMRRINRLDNMEQNLYPFFESLWYLFRRVVIAGAAVAIILVSHNLWVSHDITLASAFGASQVTVEELLKTPFDLILEEQL
ncbi:MAG: hypothetical protein MUO85_10155 [candidate division Zixibacteria bacterium]|nr:hypothetical protein [candidate division Zixibacteria bacterium]